MNKLEALKKYFGFDTFRPSQEQLIDYVLSGRDVLGIMPTGGGKSLCYQLPALLLPGVVLVISPLISLMKDQVDGLIENAIPSVFINSSLTAREITQQMLLLKNGYVSICYVAPERLNTPSFVTLANELHISLVAVDEAHCISQWGHDFRPSYKEIPLFISQLAKRPCVAAFTATATEFVKEEIKLLLMLQNPYEAVTGFDRPNLYYSIIKPQDKLKHVLSYLSGLPDGTSGIIFCATRKTVESLTRDLQKKGYAAESYHAGFNNDERKRVQENFMFDRTPIIVATNAFGMGIDKPDVRFVIHYNMPKNMESYYQEAGRAGRDGLPADCMMLYAPADIVKQKMMIAANHEMLNEERVDLLKANLQQLINYCHASGCLRGEILRYFGEEPLDHCGNCSNCNVDQPLVDQTIAAQKILSAISRTGQRFGVGVIIKVLRGSKDQKLLDWQLDQQSTYGIMAEESEGTIREIIMHLIARGDIVMTGGDYPILSLGASSRGILKGETRFAMKSERLLHGKMGKKEKTRSADRGKSTAGIDQTLYDQLVGLRKRLADEKKVPAYIIFGNATLQEMADKKPVTLDEMMDIKGVGEKKIESYGQLFVELIREHCPLSHA